MAMAEFSGYQGNPEMAELLESLPTAFLEAMQFNAFNLTTVTGFFGVMFSYFALLGAVFAVMLGSDIISKEERDKTVEFSLTLPIPRRKLITSKLFAAVVYCIAFLLITWGISIFSVARYQPEDKFYNFLTLCMLSIFSIQLIFLALGVFLGCALKYYKRTSSVAVSLLLGTYFLSIISGLNEDLDFLKYFTPFRYFDPLELLNESRIDINFVWLSAGIITVLIVGAYITYSRRDLYI
jgi:ABC-2 type transport system permease protein